MSIKIRKETKVEPELWSDEKANETLDVIDGPIPDFFSSPIENNEKLNKENNVNNEDYNEMSIETYNK